MANGRREMFGMVTFGREDFADAFVTVFGDYVARFDDAIRFAFAGILMSGMFVVHCTVLFAPFHHEAEHPAVMMVMRNHCERQQDQRRRHKEGYVQCMFQSDTFIYGAKVLKDFIRPKTLEDILYKSFRNIPKNFRDVPENLGKLSKNRRIGYILKSIWVLDSIPGTASRKECAKNDSLQ
jgi:hypothetical protein